MPRWSAEGIKTLSKLIATVAKWRWHTLYEACKEVEALGFTPAVWEELRLAFSDATSEPATLKLVDRAFREDSFWHRLSFMHAY